MKMVWLYVMIGTLSGFVGTLVPSLFRFDSNGIDWLVTILWFSSFGLLIISILAFVKASRLGRKEDELKAKDIEEKEREKNSRVIRRFKVTVEDFLKRQKAQPEAALVFLPDLIALLDYFDSERCSTLASKLRGQMVYSNKKSKP